MKVIANPAVINSESKKTHSKAPSKTKAVSEVIGNKPQHIFRSLKQIEGNNLKEISEKCGFNFTAVKKKLFYLDSSGKNIELTDKAAIIREDNQAYLGTVGINRSIVQYTDALAFTEIFARENEASYEYGGIISQGAKAFLVMKVSEMFEVCPNDPIECFFYVQTSHDSTQALTVVPAPMRSSNNTVFTHPKLTAVKLRHTRNIEGRIANAKRSLNKVKEYFKEFEESFRKLATVDIGKENRLETYLKMLYPDSKDNPTRAERTREKITDILSTEPSLQLLPTKNTLLGAYFAVVYFCDHYVTPKNTEGKDAITARLESKLSITGSAAKKKAEAFGNALKIKEKFAF